MGNRMDQEVYRGGLVKLNGLFFCAAQIYLPAQKIKNENILNFFFKHPNENARFFFGAKFNGACWLVSVSQIVIIAPMYSPYGQTHTQSLFRHRIEWCKVGYMEPTRNPMPSPYVPHETGLRPR